MKKRSLALLLALALILTSFSALAFDRVAYDVPVDCEEANYFDGIIIDVEDIDAALAPGLAERENEGMVGFEGRFALPEDEDELVSVFVMFESAPAAIQVIEAERLEGRSLDREEAEAIVEAEHDAFWDEFLAADIPYGGVLEYRLALNAVQIEVPAGRVAELAAMDSVRAVYPFIQDERELPEAIPVYDPAGVRATNDPPGNAEGRAFMRANEMHERGFTGAGIVVAIVDGGVDSRHPALQGSFITFEEQYNRMRPEHRHLLTEANNIGGYFYGRWFSGNNVTPEPRVSSNHGTHVSGTVLGRDTGTYRGVLGVAPGAINFHYRVGNRIAAVEWVLIDRPDLATMSMGANNLNTPVNLENIAYNNALIQCDMLVWVNALNNTGPFFYTADVPDNSPLVFGIAGAGIGGHFGDEPHRAALMTFSGRGPSGVSHTIRPDLTAHGQSVLSSGNLPAAAGPFTPGVPTAELIDRIPATATHAQREPVNRGSGTSYATPHVAGAVALMMELDVYLNGERTWTRAEIKSRLMHTANTDFESRYVSVFAMGGGFVDVIAAADVQTAVTVNYDRVPTRALNTPGNPTTPANYTTLSNHYWSHLTNGDFNIARVASFSFGGSNQPVADPYSRQLVAFIRNFTDVARQYTIESVFRFNAGDAATLTFSTPLMTIPAGAELPFIANFNIDPELAERGFYEGYVRVTRTPIAGETEPEVLRVPFAFVFRPVRNFPLPGGALGTGLPEFARPPMPHPIRNLSLDRPVMNTNTTADSARVNRASSMIAMEYEHWQPLQSTVRIRNAETGANVVANLNAFNILANQAGWPFPGDNTRMAPPMYHGITLRNFVLDRQNQSGTNMNLAEGAYYLSMLLGGTNQAHIPDDAQVHLPFFVDNTPPEISDVTVERVPGAPTATIRGTVYDEWATWANENGVTFPGNARHGLPELVDQSFNAVWISVNGLPSVRATVDADGAFEAQVTGLLPNRVTEVTVWAIDNYTLIPEQDAFRSGNATVNLNWGAVARDYFLPGGLMDGFVSDAAFPGYVWSGINMTEDVILVLPSGEVVDEAFFFTLPATLRRNHSVAPVLTVFPADANLTLRWTSSNPTLASVDPVTGVVTARAATGTVIITATLPCGQSHSVSIRLSA